MSLTLYVDGDRWRTHLRATLAIHPDLVPVIKGNGYGFGNARLARRAEWLGVDTVAVGTYDEVAGVASRCAADILVLTPWRSFLPHDLVDPRLIHTVGRLDDLVELSAGEARPRVVLERATSMLRHGFTARGLREAAGVLAHSDVQVEGVALHLPLGHGGHLIEVDRLMNDVVAAGLDRLPNGKAQTIWVSHLTDDELGTLRAHWPEFRFRPRIGTQLWLGDRGALQVKATVLDAHDVERGDEFGYRGRTAPRAGTILIVSGGTAHGIGLEAPSGDQSVKARAASIARGGLDAAGFVRSPYVIGGKQRLFAEPPHMQASMLFLPASARVPDLGEEVEVRVRFTATNVDHVVLH